MGRKKRTKKRFKVLDFAIYFVLAIILVGAGMATAVIMAAIKDLPALSSLEPETSEISILYDRNGDIWTCLLYTSRCV